MLLYQITPAYCGAPFSEEASATGIPDSSRVPFSTYKANGPIWNFANLVGFRPAGPRSTVTVKNVLIPENHFHDSASVRKHKGRHCLPATVRKLRWRRGCAERASRILSPAFVQAMTTKADCCWLTAIVGCSMTSEIFK
ncbi:uncharacterized protein LOC144579034 isoform X2 [Callithrix jacchus]